MCGSGLENADSAVMLWLNIGFGSIRCCLFRQVQLVTRLIESVNHTQGAMSR